MDDPEDLETKDDGSGVKSDENATERKALWSQLKDLIGADVMSKLSVPVFIMEPTTMLTKMSEILQYTALLDAAADEEDADMRLAYICALAISTYSANERTKKPFNPVLGETWEFQLPNDAGVYVSEQVSHHPPVGAGHASTEKWTYDLTSAATTKFMGNWVDVWPKGRTRVALKTKGDVFNICPPASRVNNIIVGRTWIDTFGEMTVNNMKTKQHAVIKFKECGMLGGGRWEVTGDVVGADGKVKLALVGKWNKSVTVSKPDGSDSKLLWEKEPMPADPTKYGFTQFTFKQNSSKTAPRGLLPSDSRLRPDRAALERGDDALAGAKKFELEERQRNERSLRTQKGETYHPRWFKLAEDQHLHPLELDVGTPVWEWNEKYAAASEKRAAETVEGSDPVETTVFDPWCYEETRSGTAGGGGTEGWEGGGGGGGGWVVGGERQTEESRERERARERERESERGRERERERERERQIEQRKKEGKRESVCVCMRALEFLILFI